MGQGQLRITTFEHRDNIRGLASSRDVDMVN